MKYVGIYRVLPHLDEHTNDIPRIVKDGKLARDPSYGDIYIACQNNIEIYHYGRGILVACIPSIGRGRNIIRSIYEDRIKSIENAKRNFKHNLKANESFNDENFLSSLYEDLIKDGRSLNIEETDEEVLIKFHNKHLEYFAKHLKPRTSGAGMSPFSSRNLPIDKDYIIDENELKQYQDTICKVPREKSLLISRININFIKNIIAKKEKLNTVAINTTTDMRKNCLRGKEYIHFKGYWDEYLKFLKKELKKELEDI